MRAPRGFTLLEVMVALAIFAVLGLMSSQMLTRIIKIHDVAITRGDQLGELQRAMQIMQRDVLEMTFRSVRDEMGDPIPVIRVGTDIVLELTRSGWRNPLGQRRSELQRVAYQVKDETLMRYYWNVLDRAEDSVPEAQELLHHVTALEVHALDAGGNDHAYWPLVGDQTTDPTLQLAGIKIRFDVTPFGEVTRIWDVPQPPAPAANGNPQP
jgi:general secretion pathway protein J